MSEIIDASATKEFFIRMLTRDILLHDCILDLIDNCIDGVNRWLALNPQLPDEENRYAGYWIKVTTHNDEFSISDNCRGMSIALAKTKAFHFGRPKGADSQFDKSIGLYGIGMKRAIFKMGKFAEVESSTADEAFRVKIDVNEWEQKPAWEFELDRTQLAAEAGTTVKVSALTPETTEELSDPLFVSQLRKLIARDYSFFLQKSLEIQVNEKKVIAHKFELRSSDQIAPMNDAFVEGEVTVEIRAGLGGLPPDDESPDQAVSDADMYGWFIVCNDRVVIAADKTTKTVWGDDSFPIWHPQYNGFTGFAFFRSSDPDKLPWGTTKREVDKLNPTYRKAIARMKDVTQQYIIYSGARKKDLEAAKLIESAAPVVAMRSNVEQTRVMRLPTIAPSAQYVTVSFTTKKADVKKAATSMGMPGMSASKVGQKAFEYYLSNETEE